MLKAIWSKLFGETIDPSSINAELQQRLIDYLSQTSLGETPESSLKTSLLIVSILRQAQCCYRCTLRYIGCLNDDLYPYSAEEIDLVLDSLRGRTRTSIQVCTACLGTLQYADDDTMMIQPIVDKLNGDNYEVTTFDLTLTLPLSLIHRETLLKIHVQDQLQQDKSYQQTCKAYPWTFDLVREAKDPIRSIMMNRLVRATGLKGMPKSSNFHINLCLNHPGTETEHSFLTQVKDPVLRPRKKMKKGQEITVGESRQHIVEALKGLSLKEARSLTTIPPLPQTEKASIESLTLIHDPVLTGGRYNKYSRQCSQTPWVVGGKRLTELSVSDCIVGVFKKHHQCEDIKFVTAGREDADVRMLGTGRPFYCTLINPRRAVLSSKEYEEMEAEINNAPTCHAVKVRHIQNINSNDTQHIKDGEETKRKTYQALVWFSQPLTDEIVDRCNKKGSQPFVTDQKTPIRVFQRRGAGTRTKTIHHMTLTKVDGDDNSQFGVLNLNTQAGTYIKEFVHGDLGRSQPNLATISGVEGVDLLALDVLEVDLQWPL
ncbi:hypothetical protein BC941DRAFT_425805 [Chlamydoabsidia padenii]|nr:hypothetical protein BC941DRAFT_425805 [Chlamydoabsidia padenii]